MCVSLVCCPIGAVGCSALTDISTHHSPCHNIQFEGVVVRKKSDALIELKTIYESHLANGPKADMVGCEIGNSPNKMYLNNQETCQIVMKVPEDKGDLDPPIMIHYELFNFYQNYRK
jgi:hypothetical protein